MKINLLRQMGQNPLSWDEKDIEPLLLQGEDINEKDAFEVTPAKKAVIVGKPAVLKLLIEHGAELNHQAKKSYNRDRGGDAAIFYAIEYREVECLKLLLEAGASTEIVSYEEKTPLLEAIENEYWKEAKMLVEAGANVNFINGNKECPLIETIKKKNISFAKFLLRRGADPNIIGQEGTTAYLEAAEIENCELIDALYKKKANTKHADENGDTALLRAMKYKEPIEKLIANLLCQKPNVKKANNADFTALNYSISYDNEEIACMLICAGADINAGINVDIKKFGISKIPFFMAVFLQKLDIVTCMMEHGVNINMRVGGNDVISYIQDEQSYNFFGKYFDMMDETLQYRYTGQRMKFLLQD